VVLVESMVYAWSPALARACGCGAGATAPLQTEPRLSLGRPTLQPEKATGGKKVVDLRAFARLAGNLAAERAVGNWKLARERRACVSESRTRTVRRSQESTLGSDPLIAAVHSVAEVDHISRSRSTKIMTTVSPYHSSNPADPDVYHNHDNCPSGQQIPARNRLSGKGGHAQCKHCKKLDG
jgi:hypothetical protein